MRVHIASDHAAWDLFQDLLAFVAAEGHEVVNHGAFSLDPEDDYPVFVLRAAQAVAAEPDSLGIVLGGSGNGEQIAANKVPGVRAALAYDVEMAQLAREHNNAQVLSLGGRMTTAQDAHEMVRVFLATPFSNAPRHARRLAMIEAFERDGTLPALPSDGHGA